MKAESGKLERGYVQVYCGNGKGKTTAALGLSLRAAGAGLKVFFAQFIKGLHSSEISALQRHTDTIVFEQYGRGCFIDDQPTAEDIAAARQGLAAARQAMLSGHYQVVILDEANTGVHFGLFSVEDLVKLIDEKPSGVELVITGRHAPDEIIELADLVTEMREIKHYYQHGVQARRGIEK